MSLFTSASEKKEYPSELLSGYGNRDRNIPEPFVPSKI